MSLGGWLQCGSRSGSMCRKSHMKELLLEPWWLAQHGSCSGSVCRKSPVDSMRTVALDWFIFGCKCSGQVTQHQPLIFSWDQQFQCHSNCIAWPSVAFLCLLTPRKVMRLMGANGNVRILVQNGVKQCRWSSPSLVVVSDIGPSNSIF